MPHTHTANEQVGETGVQLTKGRNPSNTHGLQKALIREIQRRMRDVRGAIRQTVGYENDALRLRQNADATEAYDYPTKQGRVRAFMRDLRRWLRNNLLGETDAMTRIRNGDHWLAEYVDNAYQVGASAAEGRLLQAGVSLSPSDPEDLLRRPVARKQLADLYGRTFEKFKDVTDDAAQQLRERLTAGVAEGKNPRELASDLTDELKSIERSRLVTIARSEIINSHAEAALDVYQDHDADVVSHTSRLTAQDPSVCAFCRKLEDVPFTIEEFRSVVLSWGGQPYRVGVPAHPNGRCSPMPEIGLSADELPPLDERIPAQAGGKPLAVLSR